MATARSPIPTQPQPPTDAAEAREPAIPCTPHRACFPRAFQGFQVFPGIYSLVPVRRERLLTLRHQQQRACNLADWLVACRGKPERIAVVGGGLAGLTFAAAYKRLVSTATITVFERAAELLPNLRDSRTRWLHPYFFSWPEPGWELQHTALPVLNWSANTAFHVHTEIMRAWNNVAGIQTYTRTQVLGVDTSNAGVRLTTKEIGAAPAAPPVSTEVDALVLAIGPGRERLHSGGMNESYWSHDGLDETPADGQQRTFVVAGAGDGALTDLLRLRVRACRDHAEIEKLACALRLRELFDKLLQGKPPTRQDREVIRAIFGDNSLRREITVTLVTDDDGRDFPHAFPIHALLCRCLHVIEAFTRIRGRVAGAAHWVNPDRLGGDNTQYKDKKIVVLEEGKALYVDGFVARVGINPPSLLSNVEAGRPLTAAEQAIVRLEQCAWRKSKKYQRVASAARACPAVHRHKILDATYRKVPVQWVDAQSVNAGGVQVAFAGGVVRINGKAFEAVLLENDDRNLRVGVLPTLHHPDEGAAYRFGTLLSAGARLFLVNNIAGGADTLAAWERLKSCFQVIEMAPTFQEFEADQPHAIGEPMGVDLRILNND
jgi:hypothetical protein